MSHGDDAAGSVRGQPRRYVDAMRSRFLDLLVGLALGGLASASASWLFVGKQLVKLQVEVESLRRDVDLVQKRIG